MIGHVLPHVVLWNLLSLSGVTVVIIVWLASFTDLFRALLIWLLISAVVLWLALLTRLVPLRLWAALRLLIREQVLASRWTWRITLGVAGFLLLVSSFLGTVEIINGPGQGDHLVAVGGAVPDIAKGFRLAAGQSRRLLCWTSWTGRDLNLRVEGYPIKSFSELRFKPWWKTWEPIPCVIPASFLRPVVIIGGDSFVTEQVRQKDANYRLSLQVGEQDPEVVENWDGRLIQIGSRVDDLPVKAQFGLLPGAKAMLARYPALAVDVVEAIPNLKADDQLNVRVDQIRDGQPIPFLPRQELIVQPVTSIEFIQPLLLRFTAPQD